MVWEDDFPEVDNGPTETVWVTKQGARIAVEDMGDSHIVNTIRYLRRNCEALRLGKVLQLSAYIKNAPDGAADAASSVVDWIADAGDEDFLLAVIPTYRALLHQARLRHLMEER